MSINRNNKAPWKAHDVLFVFAWMFLLLAIGEYWISHNNIHFEKGNSLVTIGTIVFQWLTMLLPLYFFTRKKYGASWRDFGFGKKITLTKALKFIAIAYATLILIGIAISYISSTWGISISGYES